MMGGIDQGMQQAKLSAGSDPRVLKQQYEQSVEAGSPDFLKLLAMQSLKSEADAKAKEYDLQMQQQPNTIMQQREDELMGNKQQEVMASIAPGMQQAGNQSKQDAMQQQLMGKPGGAPNPAQSGIARMASGGMIHGGGIASYAEGDYVRSPLFSPKENAPQHMQDKWAKEGKEGQIRKMLSDMPPETVELMVQGDPEASAILSKLTGGEYGGKPAAQAQGQAPEQLAQMLKEKLAPQPTQAQTTPAPPKPVAPSPVDVATPGYKWGAAAAPDQTAALPQPAENMTIAAPQGGPAGYKWGDLPSQGNAAPAPQGIAAAAPPVAPPRKPFEWPADSPNKLRDARAKQARGEGFRYPGADILTRPQGERKGLEAVDNLIKSGKYSIPSAPAPSGAVGIPPLRGLGTDQNPAIAGLPGVLNQKVQPKLEEVVPQGQRRVPQKRGTAELSESGKRLQQVALEGAETNPIDLETRRRDQFKVDNAGLAALMGEQKAGRADYKALTDRLNDPNKRRREGFHAFAAGMGGRNSSAMAGGIAGAYNARNAQEKQLLGAEHELRKMLNQEVDSATDYGTRLGKAGTSGYDTAQTAKNAALASGSNLEVGELNARVREETNRVAAEFNQINKANITALQQQKFAADLTETLALAQQAMEFAISSYDKNSPLKERYLELKHKMDNDAAKGNTGSDAYRRRAIEMEELVRKMAPKAAENMDFILQQRRQISGGSPAAAPANQPAGFTRGSMTVK